VKRLGLDLDLDLDLDLVLEVRAFEPSSLRGSSPRDSSSLAAVARVLQRTPGAARIP
jgi:hypothetical protein